MVAGQARTLFLAYARTGMDAMVSGSAHDIGVGDAAGGVTAGRRDRAGSQNLRRRTKTPGIGAALATAGH